MVLPLLGLAALLGGQALRSSKQRREEETIRRTRRRQSPLTGCRTLRLAPAHGGRADSPRQPPARPAEHRRDCRQPRRSRAVLNAITQWRPQIRQGAGGKYYSGQRRTERARQAGRAARRVRPARRSDRPPARWFCRPRSVTGQGVRATTPAFRRWRRAKPAPRYWIPKPWAP